MNFDQLKPGKTLDNNGITKIFKCTPQGGMRRSHETNTLVLVSDIQNPFRRIDGKGKYSITLAWEGLETKH